MKYKVFVKDGVDYIKKTGEENKVCQYFEESPEELIFELI